MNHERMDKISHINTEKIFSLPNELHSNNYERTHIHKHTHAHIGFVAIPVLYSIVLRSTIKCNIAIATENEKQQQRRTREMKWLKILRRVHCDFEVSFGCSWLMSAIRQTLNSFAVSGIKKPKKVERILSFAFSACIESFLPFIDHRSHTKRTVRRILVHRYALALI